ncbi:hypothetical protein SDJN02_26015, partial [Cucurbita argyrosperma subsp. argyrosperma]
LLTSLFSSIHSHQEEAHTALYLLLRLEYCTLFGSFDMNKMGKWKGCGKLGRLVPRGGSMTSYKYSLLLSPVVSVWDCIVRKMRYSYRPEWV